MPKQREYHGKSKTPEWAIWMGMRLRCENPKQTSFEYYGARGIKVCERWRNSFQAFWEDMQCPRPDGMMLERKDTNGNYEPSNCVWATPRTQVLNRRTTKRYTFNGKSLTIPEWSEETGLHKSTIERRIVRSGW